MAEVSLRSVSKTFSDVQALQNVSMEFANGGFYALLGPSGCGKTTLLRLVAGFDFPTSGSISIAGEPVEELGVEKRDVGMVFQNYALFPNMSVAGNIGFGLSVRKISTTEQVRRVGEALELVQLKGLQDRKPHELSGGQRQRVALARAIVIRPRVLLLDEPLSALDKALRVEMQVELKRIQREVGITTIFVTHDQEEALTLSDRMGILRDGVLVQEGSPAELYERPASAFAATFLGDANLFSGRVAGAEVQLECGDVIATKHPLSGSEATLAVRPEKMQVVGSIEERAAATSSMNVLEARVAQRIFAGSSVTYLLDWNGGTMKVFAQNSGTEIVDPGRTAYVMWDREHTIPVTP